jgi:hypothetical protein
MTKDEWVKKIWSLTNCVGKKICIYTVKYYSVLKKNETMSFSGKWMELEVIMSSKINKAQRAKYLMFSLICATKT